jgi:hypothetical protein
VSEPMLIVVAFWTNGDKSAEVAKALHDFETPNGFTRGAAVSFKRDVADDPEFQLVMRKLNLAEANGRPCGARVKVVA